MFKLHENEEINTRINAALSAKYPGINAETTIETEAAEETMETKECDALAILEEDRTVSLFLTKYAKDGNKLNIWFCGKLVGFDEKPLIVT